jgi:hypothetical protein
MRVLSPLLFLALAAPCATSAPPVVTGPDKVYAEVGDWAEVKVETTAKSVQFVTLDLGLKVFPTEKLKDPKATLVSALKPGKYRILCYTGDAEGPSAPLVVTVTFGTPAPPAPVVPDPPSPTPVPPKPVNPLATVLKAAFDADPAPDKRERAVALAQAMRKAADHTQDAAILRNDALAAAVTADTKALVGDSLKGVRAEIGKYLAARFPGQPVTLTADHRAAFKAAYTLAADAVASLTE